MVFTVAVIKFSVTAFMIMPGWVEDISPVSPPIFDKAQKMVLNNGTILTKDDWFATYRTYLIFGMVSGGIHALISRISHVLTRPGALRHESYMSLYAYLVCSMIMPVFILENLNVQSEKRKQLERSEDFVNYTLLERIAIFSVLSLMLVIKNMKLERGIMKRFVEDYDPELHFIPIKGWTGQDENEVEIRLSEGALDDPYQVNDHIH